MFCRCMRASAAKPNFENEDDEKEVTRLKRWKGVIDSCTVRFLQETVRISAALLHRTYAHVKQLLQMTMVTVYQWFVIAL